MFKKFIITIVSGSFTLVVGGFEARADNTPIPIRVFYGDTPFGTFWHDVSRGTDGMFSSYDIVKPDGDQMRSYFSKMDSNSEYCCILKDYDVDPRLYSADPDKSGSAWIVRDMSCEKTPSVHCRY